MSNKKTITEHTDPVACARADLIEWERARSVNFYETDLWLFYAACLAREAEWEESRKRDTGKRAVVDLLWGQVEKRLARLRLNT